MIGQIISHYKILEKLGEGGMGVVYCAEDTKLKRIVALKFLPKGLETHEPEKARFLQEAQAASALNHPNICTIHDLQDYEGQQFIVMEFVDGKTLRELIVNGQLSIENCLSFSIQIGEALQEAHSHGIVHRDVKPENIMVNTKNQIKVMDFGLAKLKGSLKLTRTSSTVGTLAYMAPEQIQGEAVDARGDIFSFGIVLYEMLTGHLPFRGEHEAAMMYSILNEEPQQLPHFRTDVPLHVASVVSKCLQKDREMRYQTMQELISDLKNVSAIQLPKQEKSIVVLPFENLSPDPDQEYFSDGLTEEVISDLSAVRSLRVISRSSAMTFKGTKKTIPEIARQVNVQYVLEGSVRKAGNNLRITAQLIDAVNDAHLWAEKYSGTLDDVFDVQEKVSRSIVAALKLKLTPEESKKIAERPIDNVVAYQCYLKANAEIWKCSESSLKSARSYLQKGLDILDENALLYSAMALVYFQYVNISAAQEDHIAKAEEYAQKALAIDPRSSQAHDIIALLNMAFYGNVREGIRHLRMALAVNPNDLDALKLLPSFYMFSLGKPAAAIPLIQRFKQVNPLDMWNYWLQGRYYLCEGYYELVLEQYRQWYQSDPESPLQQFFYALALAYNKQLDEAFSIIDQSAKTAPDNVFSKFGLLLKYGLLKDREKGFREMTPDFQKTCRRDHQWSYILGTFLALGDARKESIEWLENAVNRGFINYPEFDRNPHLDNLRSEERFKKLIGRVKFEWEHFEVSE